MQVSDRSGGVLRCLHLGSQDHLDVLLSDNRQRRAALLKGSKERDLVRSGRIECVLQGGPQPSPHALRLCAFKVLFFDAEAGRAALVRRLRQASADVGVKEMTEEELLKEALTREQRAQIVETFIRHAFSKVSVTAALCR